MGVEGHMPRLERPFYQHFYEFDPGAEVYKVRVKFARASLMFPFEYLVVKRAPWADPNIPGDYEGFENPNKSGEFNQGHGFSDSIANPDIIQLLLGESFASHLEKDYAGRSTALRDLPPPSPVTPWASFAGLKLCIEKIAHMGVEQFMIAVLGIPARSGAIWKSFYEDFSECDLPRAQVIMSYNLKMAIESTPLERLVPLSRAFSRMSKAQEPPIALYLRTSREWWDDHQPAIKAIFPEDVFLYFEGAKKPPLVEDIARVVVLQVQIYWHEVSREHISKKTRAEMQRRHVLDQQCHGNRPDFKRLRAAILDRARDFLEKSGCTVVQYTRDIEEIRMQREEDERNQRDL